MRIATCVQCGRVEWHSQMQVPVAESLVRDRESKLDTQNAVRSAQVLRAFAEHPGARSGRRGARKPFKSPARQDAEFCFRYLKSASIKYSPVPTTTTAASSQHPGGVTVFPTVPAIAWKMGVLREGQSGRHQTNSGCQPAVAISPNIRPPVCFLVSTPHDIAATKFPIF